MGLKRTTLSRRGFLAGAAGLGLTACTGEAPLTPSVAPPQPPAPASPAKRTGRRVSLDFWTGFTDGSGPAMQALVGQFNAEHADITVNYSARPWDELHRDLTDLTRRGKAPQVAAIQLEQVPTFAARSLLQPMDALAANNGYEASTFPANLWAAGIYREARYAIPLDLNTLGLFVNEEAARGAGLDPSTPLTDAEGYRAALEAAKSRDIKGHWVTPDPVPGGISALSLLYQFGGLVISDDGYELGWAGEAGLKALTWYRDLVELGYSPQPGGTAPRPDLSAFIRGDAVFRWDTGAQIEPLAKLPELKWKLARLPNIGGTAAAWAGSHQLVFPGNTPTPGPELEAAEIFCVWLINHGLEWAAGGQIPALNTVRDSAEFQRLPTASLALQLPQTRFIPAFPGITEVMAPWYTAVSEVVFDERDPKSALNEHGAAAAATLASNRKRFA